MATRTDRFEYETDTSSLSDYDSEWTQISGTEDDSDFPPLSAASERSVSPAGTIDGSVNGDVWEGLVDELQRYPSDFSDETPSVDRAATDDSLSDRKPLRSSVATYLDEDSRVTEALDCSVMSTLRASRSRSVASSLHTSLTESHSRLRLSFPDPLISPRDDSDGDAEVEPISLTRASTPTSAVDVTFEEAKLSTGASSFASIKAADYEDLDVREEDACAPRAAATLDTPCALTLALYGSASPSKWLVAERVMSLAIQYSGNAPMYVEEGTTRSYPLEASFIACKSQLAEKEQVLVRVLDRTSVRSEQTSDDDTDSLPSLAIILLPSRLPSVIPKHTRYLPLISPPSLDFGTSDKSQSSSFSEQVMRDTAQYAWNCLAVSSDEIIYLDDKNPDNILDVTSLHTLDDSVLVDKLSSVFKPIKPSRGRSRDAEKLHTGKWYSFAFVAATVLAVTAGGAALRYRSAVGPSVLSAEQALNNSISSLTTNGIPSVATETEVQAMLFSSTPSLAPTFNDSAVQTWTAITTEETAASISGSSNLSVREKGEVAPIPSTSTALADCGHTPKLSTWQEKLSSNVASYNPKELMKRPVTALRAVAKDSRSLGSLLIPQPVPRAKGESASAEAAPSVEKGKARAVEIPARTSLALIDAASTALARLTGHRDIDELNAALDDLLQALGHQVDEVRKRAKAVRGDAKRGLAYRNERARERARHIRRAGEQLLRRATESLKGKQEEAARVVQRARKNARKVREEAREVRRAARRVARMRQNEEECTKLKLETNVVGESEAGEEGGLVAKFARGRRRAERQLKKLLVSCENLEKASEEPRSGFDSSQADKERKGQPGGFFENIVEAVF